MEFLLAGNALAWHNVALRGVVPWALAGCEGMESGGILMAKPESASAGLSGALSPQCLRKRGVEAPDAFAVLSDAAVALGMLAGPPAQLNVTARRGETAAEPDREAGAQTLPLAAVAASQLEAVAIPPAASYSKPAPNPSAAPTPCRRSEFSP